MFCFCFISMQYAHCVCAFSSVCMFVHKRESQSQSASDVLFIFMCLFYLFLFRALNTTRSVRNAEQINHINVKLCAVDSIDSKVTCVAFFFIQLFLGFQLSLCFESSSKIVLFSPLYVSELL